MAKMDKQGHFVINKQQYTVEALVGKMIYVSGEKLAQLLTSIGINVPRKLRMSVLKGVLKESVDKTIEERKSLADEMGYRLTWFSRFTDSQLVNLLEWYKSSELSKSYLENFWRAFIPYLQEKNVNDKVFGQLITLAEEVSSLTISSKEFNKDIEPVMYDNEGEIDGVSIEQFRPVTYKASTLTELRAIGDKFDAPIPKRLRKQEVLEIIINKLRERKQLTSELENKLNAQNILLLERYAKDNGIKVSTELKKEEIIEYILSNAKETKGAYYVPASPAAYEKEVDEVEESAPQVEQVVVEPLKVEEVQEQVEVSKEEVKEVVREKAVHVQHVVSSGNYKEELGVIADAFSKLVTTVTDKGIVININVYHHGVEISEEMLATKKQVEAKEEVNEETPTETSEVTVTSVDQAATDDVETFEIVEVVETVKLSKADKAKYYPNRFFLALAGILAWLSSIVWLLGGLAMIPEIGFMAQLNDLISFYDLTSLHWYIYLIIGAVLCIWNLVVMFTLTKRRVRRGKLVVYGIISLVTGFGITGLVILLASIFRGKQIVEPVMEEEVPLADEVPTETKKTKKKRTFGRFIKRLLITLIIIAIIIFAGLWLVWFLPQTQGYENLSLFGFDYGKFIADSVISKIFGSIHN